MEDLGWVSVSPWDRRTLCLLAALRQLRRCPTWARVLGNPEMGPYATFMHHGEIALSVERGAKGSPVMSSLGARRGCGEPERSWDQDRDHHSGALKSGVKG